MLHKGNEHQVHWVAVEPWIFWNWERFVPHFKDACKFLKSLINHRILTYEPWVAYFTSLVNHNVDFHISQSILELKEVTRFYQIFLKNDISIFVWLLHYDFLDFTKDYLVIDCIVTNDKCQIDITGVAIAKTIDCTSIHKNLVALYSLIFKIILVLLLEASRIF